MHPLYGLLFQLSLSVIGFECTQLLLRMNLLVVYSHLVIVDNVVITLVDLVALIAYHKASNGILKQPPHFPI